MQSNFTSLMSDIICQAFRCPEYNVENTCTSWQLPSVSELIHVYLFQVLCLAHVAQIPRTYAELCICIVVSE